MGQEFSLKNECRSHFEATAAADASSRECTRTHAPCVQGRGREAVLAGAGAAQCDCQPAAAAAVPGAARGPRRCHAASPSQQKAMLAFERRATGDQLQSDCR